MAHAKLHMICGNCGCDNMFSYQIGTELNDDTMEEYQYVSICCENCSTIHRLEDNAKLEIK